MPCVMNETLIPVFLISPWVPANVHMEHGVTKWLTSWQFGKRAMDLIIDFLSCLWEYAKDQITRDIGAVADLSKFFIVPMPYASLKFVSRFCWSMADSACCVGCERLWYDAGGCYCGRACTEREGRWQGLERPIENYHRTGSCCCPLCAIDGAAPFKSFAEFYSVWCRRRDRGSCNL